MGGGDVFFVCMNAKSNSRLRGNPIVDFGRVVGVDGRTGLPVTRGQVHYGENGAHIVPDGRR